MIKSPARPASHEVLATNYQCGACHMTSGCGDRPEDCVYTWPEKNQLEPQPVSPLPDALPMNKIATTPRTLLETSVSLTFSDS